LTEKKIDWREEWEQMASTTKDPVELARGSKKVVSDRVSLFNTMKFLSLFRPDPEDIVLDAGCGTGESILAYSGSVKEMIGIDFSREIVKRARGRIINKGVKNSEVLVADLTALPFKNDFFDKAICLSVLQYVDDESFDKALNELARVTKKNGYVIFHVKNSSSPYGLTRKIKEILYRRSKDFFRSLNWYRERFQRIGSIEGEFSFGLWPAYICPAFLIYLIAELERFIRSRTEILTPFGTEYNVRIKVEK